MEVDSLKDEKADSSLKVETFIAKPLKTVEPTGLRRNSSETKTVSSGKQQVRDERTSSANERIGMFSRKGKSDVSLLFNYCVPFSL